MVAESIAVPEANRAVLGNARVRWGERVVITLLAACAAVSVLVTAAIVVALIFPTVEFFRSVSLFEFLTGTKWSPLFATPRFGVLPLVVGTLMVTFCALVVAIPCGLGSAIYLSEYASPRMRRTLKPTLEVLAGIPTIVYGFVGLRVLSPVIQDLWPFGDVGTFNALTAGIVVGILIVPLVASLADDAMTAVPVSLRQGAYALGSTRREVATKVVTPAALSGIMGSFVLAFSRAVGETTIVLIIAGNTPNLSFNPGESMQTMTGFIAAAGQGDLPTGSIGYKTIFAVGSLLFLITLSMNALSISFVRRFREVYE